MKHTESRTSPNTVRPLIILGDEARTAPVAKSLTELELPVTTRAWPPQRGDTQPEAVLLVLPIARVSGPRALRRAERWGDCPVFVLVPAHTSDARVRDLYRVGATAVFLWPREALLLPRLLAEATGIAKVRGRTGVADRALSRAVQAHLRLVGGTGGLGITAREGVVTVTGRVDALWRRQRIDETVARVPGVRDTDLSGLHVAPSGRSDRDLLASVRAVMRALRRVDEETISAVVRNGYLTLAGSAVSRAELERLLAALAQVDGIRGIENLVTVTGRRKRVDRRIALDLRRVVGEIYPREKIVVTVFGPIAVLTGKVANLATLRSVEALVAGHGQIGRVVNKLEVR